MKKNPLSNEHNYYKNIGYHFHCDILQNHLVNENV